MLFCPCRCWKRFGEMRRRIEMGERDRGREDKDGGLCIDIILGLGLGV